MDVVTSKADVDAVKADVDADLTSDETFGSKINEG